MKILVLSDSHSGMRLMRESIRKIRPDCIIHLGDYYEDGEIIAEGLRSYRGIARRMELIGKTESGADVFDDYAHHPDEITVTLNSAKKVAKGKVICIFQPHTYSRTKALFDDFVTALSIADKVLMAPIYAARETDTLGMSSEALAEEIKKLGTDAYYLPSFEAIENFVLEKVIHGDVLITMGAGDVVNIGESLLK